MAILLIRALTGYTVIERSRKGTGFDWWLGTEDNLFQGKARLEVSGVLRGTPRRINDRIKARMELFDATRRRAYWLYVQQYFETDGSRQPRKGSKKVRVEVPARQTISRRGVGKMRQWKEEATR